MTSSPPVSSKAKSQTGEEARHNNYSGIFLEKVGLSSSHRGVFSKPEGGRRFEHFICVCVCVRACVCVCTNMTSLLTGWRLLLSTVVTRGGEENRR